MHSLRSAPEDGSAGRLAPPREHQVWREHARPGRTVSVSRSGCQAVGRTVLKALGRNPDDINGVSRALFAQVEAMISERLKALRSAEPGTGTGVGRLV